MFSAIRMPIAMRTSRGYLRNDLDDRHVRARSSCSSMRPSCLAAKTGDSSILQPDHNPIRTSRALSRNGIRQPQASKLSSLWNRASAHSTPAESRLPSGTPAWVHDVQNPRRRLVAVLGGHQHRSAPFAADGEALQQPAEDQQQRCGDPDAGVGREQPDREGRPRPSAAG